jgi:monofunctional biosynthetic peptidoglycan transglycosylase
MTKKNKVESTNPLKYFVKYLFFTIALYLTFSVFIILFFIVSNPPTTAFILSLEANSNLIPFSGITPSQTWLAYKHISDEIKVAVIASEDQRFKDHFGFDFREIKNALDEMDSGKRVRGASTISQQVAKNLFLTKDKTIIRKFFEAYYTLLIEVFWSKERILEVYLNVVELGKNVYGVEAASQAYFGKSAEFLTKSEAALLAAVLPNPQERSIKQPSDYLIRRQKQIIKQTELIGGVNYIKDL